MIVHLDADAFFASVEQAADPKLRGKPVAVGGERRGIIASASYEARKLGIYTPMPTVRARKLCPRLIIVRGDFEKYEQFSRFMFSYAYDFTPHVEIASIDEGYFDLGHQRQHAPRAVAETIRHAIRQSLKITVSEGIASNKLVSQIASKLRKPACFLEVDAGRERDFLDPLANKWLPGVGPKLSDTLNSAGLVIIQQIAETPPDLLSLIVGNYAPQLRAYARGIDDRQVIREASEAKSYGQQETFFEDVTDDAFILANLRVIADRLAAKVREDRKSFRTITLKLRYNDFQDVSRSVSLEEPADMEQDVYPLLPTLLRKAWERRVSIRMVALKLSHIYGGIFRTELSLDEQSRKRDNERRLAGVLDGLRENHSIMRGHDLWLKQRKNQPRADTERRAPTIRTKPSANRVRDFVPLNIKSYYSFLDSALSIPTIIETAVERGIKALAITDPNLHGAVEFFTLATEAGIKPIIGAELQSDGCRLNAYAANGVGYAHLCEMLSMSAVSAATLKAHGEGLIIVRADSPDLALPEIRYRLPSDRPKLDVIQSIRTLTRLHEAHPEKPRGDFHFPTAAEVGSRWRDDAILATHDLAERCEVAFEFGRLRFPHYAPDDGSTPHEFLARLAHEGLHRRYGERAHTHEAQLREELSIIAEVGYEEYFLVVWDILQECQRRGIAWITRGSAADSLVCYSLGISGVCPIRFELYFRRFLNRERMALNKLPDIDIDFAHDRKDDVVDLIFERYGPRHAAIVGGLSTYQGRSAIADIAKVLGVSEFQIRRLTEHVPRSSAGHVATAVASTQECQDSRWQEEPYRTALQMASFLDGFPRHPKMHPCGVVLSRDPITALTPTFTSAKGYATTHFEMEAVETVGLVKMDILAQGGLAVIRDTLALLAERGITPDLENLEPWEDVAIWQMIATGNARGVHHIESPAMISLARMCGVRDIDCLIAIVSVIRPGAANSSKKSEFARRAQGLEPVQYAHPSLEPALHMTFGVVAYEEHILQICEAFAGLNPGRADVLRRALVKEKDAVIEEIRLEFVAAAKALQRTEEEIARVWELVGGFRGYAFCRAHSTAYGVEAYQGAYLKHYHPAEFLASVLSNGKGFYSTLAYTLECRRLGLTFLSPDVNASRWNFAPEDGQPRAIRVPLRFIKSLTAALLARYQIERTRAPFASLRDFYERTRPTGAEMLNLIRAGAFDGFGEPRTAQFWHLQHIAQWPHAQGYLFQSDERVRLPEVPLTEPDHAQRLRDESELLSFTVSGHPLEQFPDVAWDTYCPIRDLARYPGERVSVCGLIIADRSHHQIAGDQMKFITICDYTGIIECEIFAQTYRRFGLETVRHPVVEVEARVTPFDSGLGCTLEVMRVGRPRRK
ncbi:MAG: DNA polymerase III subunit alpha [Chthoniobacteraceae bacterium]